MTNPVASSAEELLDDAVTDAFMIARDSLGNLDNPDAVGSWLLTIAKRQLFRLRNNAVRHRRRQLVQLPVGLDELADLVVAPATDQPETAAITDALRLHLAETLTHADFSMAQKLMDKDRVTVSSLDKRRGTIARSLLAGGWRPESPRYIAVGHLPSAPSALQQEIWRLPTRQKQVLHLHVYRSLRPKEIAQSLFITPNNARANLCMARQKLAKRLSLDLATLDRELRQLAAQKPVWLQDQPRRPGNARADLAVA
ncbi:RNA polymerase sigma factor [Saccharopolyspora shandongensis]|uniref:RNA polymerase sigma factor n=1 Tax=Saccharopolyspora shandongensis TaxID=418495 RepID=UPI0033F289A1